MPVPTAQSWNEHALSVLSEAGYRAGGARSAVIEVLGEAGGCLSADEVGDRIRESGRRAGTASVYRALNVLTDVGVLHAVSMAGAAVRYELVLPGGDHHHHAVCERCGKSLSFDDPHLEAAIERVSKRLPYAISAHELTLRGQCPACRRR